MNLVERLKVIWSNFVGDPNTAIAVGVSVVVFTVLYFYMLKFLVGNEAGSIASLFTITMIIGAALLSFIEGINMAVYLVIPAVFIIAILVLYATEIRRIIWARRKNKAADVKHDVSYD